MTLPLAKIGLVALVTTIWGQSNAQVVVYGTVDTGFAIVDNIGGKQVRGAVNSASFPSAIGIRGTEPLGGGWSVVFRLESGFGASTGSLNNPTVTFDRQAFVGVSSASWGTLTVGRHSKLNFDMIMPLHAMGSTVVSTFAFHPGNFDDLVNTSQSPKSVKYRTQKLSGFEAAAVYSTPGNLDPSKGPGEGYQVAASYSTGPLTASASIGKEHDRMLRILPTTGITHFLGTNLTSTPFIADKVQNSAVGLRYSAGRLVLAVLATETEFFVPGHSSAMRSADLSGRWRLYPDISVGLGVTRSTLGEARWTTVGTTLTKYLSPRTSVYGHLIAQKGSGGASGAIGFAGGISSDSSQRLLAAGIRHGF